MRKKKVRVLAKDLRKGDQFDIADTRYTIDQRQKVSDTTIFWVSGDPCGHINNVLILKNDSQMLAWVKKGK